MQPVRESNSTTLRSTATKAPVGLWLARGSHPVGMSNVVAVSCNPYEESNSTAARRRQKEPTGLFFSASGCGSQHPRVPWAARASCWPLPQQLLPASATGRGRRCCRSHPVGMSTVVAAAAFARGIFNLTRTGTTTRDRAAVRLHLEYYIPDHG